MVTYNTPATQAPGTDPGGETLRRYGYQISYTAYRALDLIEPNPDVDSIYCEYYDDVIARKKNGKFVSVQIKTRAYGQPEIRANDDEVLQTISIFINLDLQFPGIFDTFEIVTNHNFKTKTKSSTDLPYLIELSKCSTPFSSLPSDSISAKHFRAISKKCSTNLDHYQQVLARIELKPFKHSIDVIRTFVFDRLSEIVGEKQSVEDVKRRVDALINLILNKSFSGQKAQHLKNQQFGIPFKKALETAETYGKRVSKDEVSEIIYGTQADTPETTLVETDLKIYPSDIQKPLTLLHEKMQDGYVESERIRLTRSNVYSVQFLYIEWEKQYGPDKAYKMFDDVLWSVLTFCTEAKLKSRNAGVPYGSKMYELLFSMLDFEAKNYKDTYQGCRTAHLMGFAGVLTNNCTVPWSDKYDKSKDSYDN